MPNNIVFEYFVKGGWIMGPILLTSLVAAVVIIERFIWWNTERKKREPEKLDKVYVALEKGDVPTAKTLAREGDGDPILRIIWHGLNHYHSSLQGALQMASGIEIERAGRYIVVMDTIVTLAPLLGLLGTVTGLMRAFFRLGITEISAEAISGGIAEALIATACGLTIAVVCLIALNYFSSKVARYQFELETACTNVELLMGSAAVKNTPTQPAPVTA